MIIKINNKLFKLELREKVFSDEDETKVLNEIKDTLKIASKTLSIAKDYVDGDDRSRLDMSTDSKIEMCEKLLEKYFYRKIAFEPLLESDEVVDL